MAAEIEEEICPVCKTTNWHYDYQEKQCMTCGFRVEGDFMP